MFHFKVNDMYAVKVGVITVNLNFKWAHTGQLFKKTFELANGNGCMFLV